tara:strand:+ start:371 stop:616 length:246 start_codon:yes stop_codon:yes gene_type:complete
MLNKLEAIKEAIIFIRNNWISGVGHWEGEISDFVGATLFGDVTKSDIAILIQAINDGEYTGVEGIEGTFDKKTLKTIRVLK